MTPTYRLDGRQAQPIVICAAHCPFEKQWRISAQQQQQQQPYLDTACMPARKGNMVGAGNENNNWKSGEKSQDADNLNQNRVRKLHHNYYYVHELMGERNQMRTAKGGKQNTRRLLDRILSPGTPYLSYVLSGPIQPPAAHAADRPKRIHFVRSSVDKLTRVNR